MYRSRRCTFPKPGKIVSSNVKAGVINQGVYLLIMPVLHTLPRILRVSDAGSGFTRPPQIRGLLRTGSGEVQTAQRSYNGARVVLVLFIFVIDREGRGGMGGVDLGVGLDGASLQQKVLMLFNEMKGVA